MWLRTFAAALLIFTVSVWVNQAASPADAKPVDLRAGVLYGVTVSARDLNTLGDSKVRVAIGDPQGVLAEKVLHAFDPDFYFTLRARTSGPATIIARPDLSVTLTEIGTAAGQVSEQKAKWTGAQSIRLNETVLASADERPYVPVNGYADLLKGQHWYRFTATADELAFFAVEATDRDVPADLDVFQLNGGVLEPYSAGAHQYIPEATQNFPGLSNYRTRKISAGHTYYLRVSANHPAYRLRTATYALPPYRDPRQAVRTAMDFTVSLGDSWLNNIPRRGSVATRDTLPHPETQNCIACHPTQFTTRAYLTAVRNGYTPVNRVAADSLIWQLRNNPRPLAGHESANWARVIFSARTVSSRLPVLLDDASVLPGFGPAPPDIVTGAAGYLKLHYKGLDKLAEDEADGASPAVSPLEIGLQSWQTFGLAGDSRSTLESQIAAYEPRNVIDLNWKIIALSTIDRSKYSGAVGSLVEELMRKQTPDLRFGGADFITYHSLYALATAGLKASDPRVAKLVEFTLRNQLPSGGWQGEPGPKAFQTPFRETQFAVMALSTLFPASDPVAAPAAAVDPRRTASVLEREATARAWTGSIDTLMPLLGDESKLVQTAAAESIRRTLSRDLSDVHLLNTALRSPDSRMRSGALRVFARQFRALAGVAELRGSVKALLEDPAPLIRLQAAMALARWNTWSPEAHDILESLSARLPVEQDPRVARVLTEGVSGILDENIGYVETWMRTMSDPADRQKTVDALHARSKAQGAVLAKHLGSVDGNREGKLRLLTSLWDLPLRHMAIPATNRDRAEVVLPAYYSEYSAGVNGLHEDGFAYEPYQDALSFRYGSRNGFHKTRIGNDSELVDLTGAGPELEEALIALIRGTDRELKIAAIKAGASLGNSMSRRFTMAAFEVLRSQDKEARDAVRYVFENGARGRLTLGDPDVSEPEFVRAIEAALDPATPDALAVALPLVAELPPGSVLSRDVSLMSRIDALLFTKPLHPKALSVASSFPRVADGPLMRTLMLEGLASPNRAMRIAAAETAVRAYLADPTMPALAEQFAAASKGEVRRMMLDLLDPSRFSLRLSALSLYNPGPGVSIPPDAGLFSSEKVQQFVAMSLGDADPDVRAAAQDLTVLYPAVKSSPAVQMALAKFPLPKGPRTLDYDFFVAKVQPILARPGADGKACVVCHVSHGIFPLRLPAGRNGFTDKQSRENFQFASRVVDLSNPQKSLLLVKPTRPNDSAGDPNLYLATHNGGERWSGNETSEEYQTILRWIRGAKN
jgi:hypothetical protein